MRISDWSSDVCSSDLWMTRSVAFGDRDGLDWAKAAATGRMRIERLPLLTPSEDEDLSREAGFTDVALLYDAFSFRGWVGTSGSSAERRGGKASVRRGGSRWVQKP